MTNNTVISPVYPMLIQKYNTLIPDPNANVLDKINTIIDYLNQTGKLTNDVVNHWNQVMAWAMNDGLNTDVSNKLETMLSNGEFDSLFQKYIVPSLGDIKTLQTNDKTSAVNAINEVDQLAKTNQTNLGTLSNLTTTDKSSLVNAVNEADNLSKSNQTNIGTLANLQTTDKGNLVAAINDNVASLADIMQNVKRNYGAVGDGNIHTISSMFPNVTMAQVQSLNSNATLNNSADWYALQTAFNAGGNIFIPAGTYMIDLPLNINTSNTNIYGVIEKSKITNTGTGHSIVVNKGCVIDGLILNNSSYANNSGSGLFLTTSGKFSNLDISGFNRYGIEFSSTAVIVSCHFNKCTISYNVLGGIYSYADGTYQKNLVAFYQCYITHNGLNSNGSDTTDATPTTGHGIYINGGIAWSFMSCVSEVNSGAGIYITNNSGMGIRGLIIEGCHLESSKYANIYLNNGAGYTCLDININANYYTTATNYPSGLTASKGSRTIVANMSSINYYTIDRTIDQSIIAKQLLYPKQSLKIGGEFESVTPFNAYTNQVISNDPNSGGYNVLRLDSTLGSNYAEPLDLVTFIDPRFNYRIIYEYYFSKSSSTSASLYLNQLDASKNTIGGATINNGLASGAWYTQEKLITPSQLNTNARYLQINPLINGTLGSGDYLLIRKVLIYRIDGVVPVSGTTANRPNLLSMCNGYNYFDTSLNKSIWWDSVNSKYRDSNGVSLGSASTPNAASGTNVSISASATTYAVTGLTENDTNYIPEVALTWNSTWWVTNKTNTGFTINFGTVPSSASTLDWSIKR